METGDIMEQRGPRTFVWIDRKKNIMKLSQARACTATPVAPCFPAPWQPPERAPTDGVTALHPQHACVHACTHKDKVFYQEALVLLLLNVSINIRTDASNLKCRLRGSACLLCWVPVMTLLMMHRPRLHQPWRLDW